MKRIFLSLFTALLFASGTVGTYAQTANGRATTAAPSYTNNTAAPLSLDLSGNLRTAGTATVSGTVAVSSLPSIPAGTNNIGDVDVLSLPSIPAGANSIGNIGTVTAVTGITNALPAGANTIGNINTVATITNALPTGTNNIGNTGAIAINSAAIGPNATTTPVVYRATAGTLDWINLSNASAGLQVTFYDNASACSGTVKYIATLVAASNTIAMSFANPISFSNGLTACTTTGSVSVGVGYR